MRGRREFAGGHAFADVKSSDSKMSMKLQRKKGLYETWTIDTAAKMHKFDTIHSKGDVT